MVEEMKKYLMNLLGKIDGLLCILITDREGVPVVKVTTEQVPDGSLRPSFISTFTIAAEQGKKLGLRNNKSLISFFNKYQVVQLNKPPMIITFIAHHYSNTGHILALEDQIDPLIGDLKLAIIES